MAFGTLKFPIFREAGIRGNEDASLAQMQAVNNQLADLHSHIDQQVRSALLDVTSNKKLVDVARSNVDLATQALSDETDRVTAGVDDNLPLVDAQASLSAAQTNLVEASTNTTCRSSRWRDRAGCWSSSTGFIWAKSRLPRIAS